MNCVYHITPPSLAGCRPLLRMKSWITETMNLDGDSYEPGEEINGASPLWTLAKGVMHGERAMKVEEQGGCACHCCDRLFFLPTGCACNPPEGILTVMGNKMCEKCSQCLRCGKRLGPNLASVGVVLCMLPNQQEVPQSTAEEVQGSGMVPA